MRQEESTSEDKFDASAAASILDGSKQLNVELTLESEQQAGQRIESTTPGVDVTTIIGIAVGALVFIVIGTSKSRSGHRQ